MDVAEVQRQLNELERTKRYPNEKKRIFPFIADGGIKSAGDIVKALCFADMVMVGNLFAGCEETPGLRKNIGGTSYKEYVGSSTYKTNHIEGVAALVPTKGTYKSVLNKLLEGLRSGCSYQGAHNLEELKDNPAFIRITNAGLKESHPHDVFIK
jgi:IMP dehydrogenase